AAEQARYWENTQLGLAGIADKPSLMDKAIRPLLQTTSSALHLMAEVDRHDDSRRDYAVRLGTAHEDPLIRDLFERYLPEEARVKRLGTSIKPEDILALPGNAQRGKQLF